MKRATLSAIATTLESIDFENKSDIMVEIYAELNKTAERKAMKANEYAEAWDVVKSCLMDATAPVTVAEIYEACEDTLPEGFSKAKVQYGLRVYWGAYVTKVEGKVNAYTLNA